MRFFWLMMLASLLSIGLGLGIFSCARSSNIQSSRMTTTIYLPVGRKLTGITWKVNALWTVTTEAQKGEFVGTTWHLDEWSSWGILNGHYVLQEIPK